MSTLPRQPIGWPLLPKPDENGELSFPTLEDSVRQSIRVILSTRPGEQLMRPRFGAGLQEYIHQPNTLTVRRRIRDSISSALGRYEPRIVVDRIDVSEATGAPTEVRVEIAYRIRRTGASGRAALTLALGG